MTPEQYGQVATWFAKGRGQYRCGAAWRDMIGMPRWPDFEHESFADFREKPPEPQMPDEVYLPNYGIGLPFSGAYATREACAKANASATPVRYVRADHIIDGSELEFRNSDSDIWRAANGCKYRLKP